MADPMVDGTTQRAGARDPAFSLWVSLAHRWLTDPGPGRDPVRAPSPEGGPCDLATGSVSCP